MVRNHVQAANRSVPSHIPIKQAKLRTGHGTPYLIVNACPDQGVFHPLDTWFDLVRQEPADDDLFGHLGCPSSKIVECEEQGQSKQIHGAIKLNWSIDNPKGPRKAKLRIRCNYKGFERVYRISLSCVAEIDEKFLDQLAAEIEPY